MNTMEEELIKMKRKYEQMEKINKELTDYVNILKKNVEENKKMLHPLQEENAILTRSLIEKNDKIQSAETQLFSLQKDSKIKDATIQDLNEKLNKYKEIFQFVTMKTKNNNIIKKPLENMNEALNYSVPFDFPKRIITTSPSFHDQDMESPPPLPRAYSSIISKYTENKPDFSRKSIGKRASNDFVRDSKIQEFQKEIEQFYSFDKKKSGILFVLWE